MELVFSKPKASIYITGTTRGLGKHLKDRYENEYPFEEVVGLDRPEYDLKNIEKFVKKDFDIYIMNAHYEWSQTELLYRLFEENQYRKCQIVVIGSVSADGDRKAINKYAIEKKALDAACTQLQLVDSKCIITQVKLGRMETDMAKHIKAKKMDPRDVAYQIYQLIELNNSNDRFIKTVTLDVKEDVK